MYSANTTQCNTQLGKTHVTQKNTNALCNSDNVSERTHIPRYLVVCFCGGLGIIMMVMLIFATHDIGDNTNLATYEKERGVQECSRSFDTRGKIHGVMIVDVFAKSTSLRKWKL